MHKPPAFSPASTLCSSLDLLLPLLLLANSAPLRNPLRLRPSSHSIKSTVRLFRLFRLTQSNLHSFIAIDGTTVIPV